MKRYMIFVPGAKFCELHWGTLRSAKIRAAGIAERECVNRIGSLIYEHIEGDTYRPILMYAGDKWEGRKGHGRRTFTHAEHNYYR